MLAQGVTYPQLMEMLKGLFVDVAERDFRLAGKAQTDSRISLLSGVHRKDVRRLRAALRDSAEHVPGNVSLGAQLVAAWISREPYVDAAGQPRPLPRLAKGAGEASFEGLVSGVSKDIRSRAVLDEWLRLGVVSLNEHDEVVLSTEAFVPQQGFEEKAFYFAHNLHDHAAAAAHNLTGAGVPWFERSVHYDALAGESIERLRELGARAGMDALQKLNREAMACEQRDAGAAPAQRFTFGVYFYSAPTRPPPETEGEA